MSGWLVTETIFTDWKDNKAEAMWRFRVSSWWILDGVKLTAQTYIDFLKVIFLWSYSLRRSQMLSKKKMIFLHDNTLSHPVKKINECLNKMDLQTHLMKWESCLAKLNLTENFSN